MPSRPMNKGRSNDHDFVPPTQYKSSRTKQPRPSLLSQFEQIPKFEAMELENTKGSSQIPCTSSPEDLFSLFFTDSEKDQMEEINGSKQSSEIKHSNLLISPNSSICITIL
jgi:hypothetical protein